MAKAAATNTEMLSKFIEESSFEDGTNDDNLQEQQDEVLALQSIFNKEDEEKVKILSEVTKEKHGCFALEITVCPNPSDSNVQVDLVLPAEVDDAASQGAAAKDSASPPALGVQIELNRTISGVRWQGSISVKYLSPMHLYVTFPPSYPSREAPASHIMCGWLSDSQIESLRQMLASLWEECPGMPVVFIWIDWLENNALSYLGIVDHLVLHVPQTMDDSLSAEMQMQEKEAAQEELGAVVATLIRYNRKQLDIEFCQSNHECHVCYDEKPGFQFFRMLNCQHNFCHICMTEFCALHVREGTVEELRCPDTGCDAVVPPHIVQAVLGAEAYERWEKLLLQKTLDAMSDTVYCPRCRSLVIADQEEELHMAHCLACFFTFCTQCERVWHQSQECQTDEEILEIAEQKNANALNPAEKKRFDEIIRKLREVEKNKKQFHASTKVCPKCKIRVEKIGGCNKMTCKCGQIFCWICGKSIGGYEHFRTGNCTLFPNQGVQPAAQVNLPPEAVLRMQARLEINPALENHRCRCPSCRQQNLKGEDNNNHIKCWNCKSSFCFQCRQRINGSIGLHYQDRNDITGGSG